MVRGDRTIGIDPVLKIATFLIALLVFLTVCVYVGPVLFGVFLLLFLAACWCEWRRRFLPRIVLTIASFAILGLFIYRLHLVDLAPQAVETLLLLLAIKLLERKEFRDHMQIYVISVFLLAGSALLGISLIFLSYVVVLAFFFNAAMVLVAYYKEDPGMVLTGNTIWKIIGRSSLIPVCAIPMGALIFIITPRTPFPLLDFLNQGNHSTSGFTDQVRLGKVSDIQEDGSVVFRASMNRVPAEDLYWRGIVLDHFNGAIWRSAYKRMVLPGPRARNTSSPSAIRQEIYLEPHGNIYLFALDRPSHLLLRSVKEYADATFTSDQVVSRKIRYGAVSADVRQTEEAFEQRHYVQLPGSLSASTTELARELRAERGPRETLDSIERFLNGPDFTYSLTDLPITRQPLEDFLFVHRSGNCEYFASAFAVLARINGIPARLVAGYYGGLYNDLGGYYLVSEKNAHVWVEAFVPGAGWHRYDPTPASGRIHEKPVTGLLSMARLYLDGINYFWVAFIVNYDVQKQFALFTNTRSALSAGSGTIAMIPIKRYLAFLVGAVVLIYGAVRIRGQLQKSPAERLTALFLGSLEKRGYVRKPSQGLEEFVAAIRDEPLRARATQIAKGFEKTYYRDQPFSGEEIKRLRQLIKELPDS
jgi:protein-glutamine gamma-glutamyltransferase